MRDHRRGLTAGHLAELVQELRPLVVGSEVREVQALPPHDVLLILAPSAPDAADGPIRRLRLSADPRAARVHLQIGRVRRHPGPPGPFYRQLAEELPGLTLTGIDPVGGDRVLHLSFAGPGRAAALVVELFGRHANLVLLDARGTIVTLLVRPAPESAAAARLAVHGPYAAPPGQPPAVAGPPLDQALPGPGPPAAAGTELARLAPLSWRVESSLGSEAEEHHVDQERKDLRRRLDRARKSTRHLIHGLEEKRRTASDAERVRMDAELLTAHFGRLKRGMREIEVDDFHVDGAPKRTLALDPGLSPQKNAERLFKRYKKLKRAAERVPEELALAEARRDQLEALAARLDGAQETVADVEREAVEAGLLRPRQAPPERRKVEPRRPYHRFETQRGLEIRVGRSARDNDELTFRHARGNDLWLHTADAPGSHIVLRLAPGQEADAEDILDAAHLAVHFSPLRGTRRADVHVAHCKEVRKPRRAPAGLVTLSGGKIRVVRVDEERLARLLDARKGSGDQVP